MKLVIDLPDEVVKWFERKGFIPIGQYLTVDEAMKKAKPLSEVLNEIKGEIEKDRKFHVGTFEADDPIDYGIVEGIDKVMDIIDKHIDKADMRDKSCSTCKNNDDGFSGECYECVKNIQNHYEPQESEADFPQAKDIEPTVESFSKMLDNKLIRDATSEEREGVDNYIKNISTKTGKKFDE